MSKTRAARIAEEKKLMDEWVRKGGKVTKGKTKYSTPTETIRTGQRAQTGKGGSHRRVANWPRPAGGVAVANVEKAQKKAAAEKEAKRKAAAQRNAKKKVAKTTKKTAPKTTKKTVKVTAHSDTPGRFTDRKTGTDVTQPIPKKKTAKIPKGWRAKGLHFIKKLVDEAGKSQRKAAGAKPKPAGAKPTKAGGGGKKPPTTPKSGTTSQFLGRGPKKTGPSSVPKTKPPTRWGKGLQAAARTAPAVVAVGALGREGVGTDSKKGRGTHTPYSVKKGDTLSEIARDKGTTLKALLAANDIKAKDANKLRIGQKLVLPGKVKDRKSVYQGMTKSQMAAMHMPKTKRSESMGGDIDSLHGTTRKKKHDVSKYSDMKKKKPIKKKPKKKEPNTLFGFEIDPPEGGREVKLPFGLGSYKTISDAEREKAFAIDNKRGGQIKGYKKGGKVKKVRKASRPRGVGVAMRGWGKAMR